MKYKIGLHPGTTWRKCDFQIHTPRDPQWSGNPNLPALDSAGETARDRWAEEFVQKAIEKKLEAIAITDHHDFCLIPYVQKAITKLKLEDRLWLFPGVEVTCDDSTQCLVLFDPDTGEDLWNRLYGGHLKDIEATNPQEAKAEQAQSCGKSISLFIAELLQENAFKDKIIILPHGGKGGHKTVIRDGFHKRFRDLPVDGFYIEKPIDHKKIREDSLPKIRGQIKEWGTRRRGVIPTGDNRSSSYQDLGKHDCWIRLGENKVEAIRQALLADEARVVYTPPISPAHHILHLEVNSSLTGSGFELSFNDGFNALIGGRGAGKSSLIEYIRFALGRSAWDIASNKSTEDQNEDSHSREIKLLKDTLAEGGSVKIALERDGVIETWSRNFSDPNYINIEIDGESEIIHIQEAKERFRARAFYQKQLSTLVADRSQAAQQITGIAAAEHIDKRFRLEREIDSTKLEINTLFLELIKYWKAEANLEKEQIVVKDLKRRSGAIQEKLKDAGLSKEKQDTLEKSKLYEEALSLFDEIEAHVEADIEFAEGIEFIDVLSEDWSNVKHFESTKELLEEAHRAHKKIRQKQKEISAILTELEEFRLEKKSDFYDVYNNFQKELKKAQSEKEGFSSLIKDSNRISEELKQAEVNVRKAKSSVSQFMPAKDKMSGAFKKLSQQLKLRDEILLDAVKEVNNVSSDLLEASIRNDRAPEEYVSALKSLFLGAKIQDLDGKSERKVQELTQDGARSGWLNFIKCLITIYKEKVRQDGVEQVSADMLNQIEECFGDALSLTDNQKVRFYKLLTGDRLLNVIKATHSGYISFEYIDSNNKIPFELASPGQQSSVLLNLLLHQEAGTLIIDQPEDDLDSKTIMKIVELVKRAKTKRQLIFATHNANFVVNGDADKVISLRPENKNKKKKGPRIAIEVDGAIETNAIRQAITDTMEGGEKAFDLRRRKYSFTEKS